MSIIIFIVNILLWVIAILLSVALLTLLERKLLGSMQRRLGPDTVGIYGILQPIADAIKLATKQTSRSDNSTYSLFYMAPMYALMLLVASWSIIVMQYIGTTTIHINVLFTSYQWLLLLAILSLTIYSVLLLGWAANSSYAFIGSLRSSAALVSYELILAATALMPILCSQSYDLYGVLVSQQSMSYIVMLLPVWVMFYISCLAESSRIPFDLVEAESELVSGYMTEHASVAFVLLFLGEYASLLLFANINSILWLGTSNIYSLALGMSGFLVLVILLRALLPRMRYDQLIVFCWTNLLPLIFVLVIAVPILLVIYVY